MSGINIPGIEPVFKPQTTGLDKAMGLIAKAHGYYGGMQQDIKPPPKTVGGGLTSGLSGATAGASIGSAIGGTATTAGTTAAGATAAGATTAGAATTTGAASGSTAGPWGAVIGAGVGLLGYYLS